MDPEHCKTVQRNAVRQSGRDNEGMRRGRRACPQNRTEADAPNYKHGMYVAPWRKSLLDCSITVEAFAAGPWGNATKRLSGPGMLTGDSVKCF